MSCNFSDYSFSNMMGVYAIINLQNNKLYIGQSKNIMRRFRDHAKNLKEGTHPNSCINEDCNCDFAYRVLQIVKNPKYLLSIEEKWIKKYKSTDRLYNIDLAPASVVRKKRKSRSKYVKKESLTTILKKRKKVTDNTLKDISMKYQIPYTVVKSTWERMN